MRLLIGYNGTDASRCAIDDLKNAGLPATLEAHVVTVGAVKPARPDLTETQAINQDGIDRVHGAFPRWNLSGAVSTGSPHKEMLAVEKKFRPDLIVLGERERSARNLPLSLVSQGMLTYSESPIRISKTRPDDVSGPLRLLVGFTNTAESQKAIAAIAGRSWPGGTLARLVSTSEDTGLLGSISHLPSSWRSGARGSGLASGWAETLAEPAIQRLSEAGVIADVEVRAGMTQKALVEAAADFDADCIFLAGQRPFNSFERFLFGGLSAAVAANANCSVELVR
jgi:nucleotide-binding universal stress UspA family protein